MPTFTVPDNFTVSDDEFRASKLEQEKVYRDEGKRQADRTYLDPLGHARWDTDYVTMRMAGYSHSQALQEMRVRIREAWNPPLPAIEQHVPPPAQPQPQPHPDDTPVAIIRAALRQVDQQHPEWRIRNRREDCGHALELAARIAGPAFAYVGKTADRDGNSKFVPQGFVPFDIELTRDDGQRETVRIVAVSIDALWHLPTMTQIKAIANSADGELADGGAGRPADYNSYPIDEFKDGKRQYRWYNPPVRQF